MSTDTARPYSFNDTATPGPGGLGSVALLLDIDGTILDMAITPGSVIVSGSLRSSLTDLHARCGGALALVSGRLIRDIDNLFAPLRLPAIGGHGAEMRLSGNSAVKPRHADAVNDGIRRQVAAIASADRRLFVEDKTTSIAVHYRLAPELEQTLRSEIDEAIGELAAGDLEILHGKAVIEIKSRHYSKGTAVLEIMKNPPFRGRKPVFVGDDVTDVSVFKILPLFDGIGYAVERAMPGANGVFGSPAEVRSWLGSLCEVGGNVLQ